VIVRMNENERERRRKKERKKGMEGRRMHRVEG
jgi:hypothetical protein